MTCGGVFLSNRAQSQFAETNELSWQWSVYCECFHGIPLGNNTIECHSVPVVEALFDDNRCPVGTQSPSLVGHFFSITFTYYWKWPLNQVFLSSIKCPSIPTISPCILPSSPSPSTMQPDLLLPVHLGLPIKSILFPHTMGTHVSTTVPSSIPTFCESTDCRLIITYVVLNVLVFYCCHKILSPKSKFGRVGLIWLTLLHCCSSLKTTRTGTETSQEPGGRS